MMGGSNTNTSMTIYNRVGTNVVVDLPLRTNPRLERTQNEMMMAALLKLKQQLEGKDVPRKGTWDEVSIKLEIIRHFKNLQVKVVPHFRGSS